MFKYKTLFWRIVFSLKWVNCNIGGQYTYGSVLPGRSALYMLLKLLSDSIFGNLLSPWLVVCLPPISLWFCTDNLMQNISQHWLLAALFYDLEASENRPRKQPCFLSRIFVHPPPPPPPVYNGALQPPFLWNCLVFFGKHVPSTRLVNS